MKKLCAYVALLVISLNAWSWSERGNGGNTIICNDPSRNQFYDSFEAEYRYNLKPNFPEFESKCTDDFTCLKAAIIITRGFIRRIPTTVPKEFTAFLRDRLRFFDVEANILDGIELIPVSDVGIGFVPKGCKLQQTFLQRKPLFPNDMRYIISNDYWKLISTKEKAVGILHELLYGYYGELKISPNSSEGIRYLNALIISGEIEKISSSKFDTIFKQVYSNE